MGRQPDPGGAGATFRDGPVPYLRAAMGGRLYDYGKGCSPVVARDRFIEGPNES
jgi:hypothetical protein